jgi:hypothetical protein
MASRSCRMGLFGSCIGLATLAHVARAASPDPRTLRDQLEDQVLDGDRDAEDLAAFHVGRQGFPHPRGQAYLAVQAFTADVPGGRELGAFVVLQLPFDRFASPAHPVATELAPTPAQTVPLVSVFPSPPPRGSPGIFQQIEPAEPKIASVALVVTTDVARACVRAAWRTLGIVDDSRVDSMASRARTSAVLPEVRLRAVRTIDESGRLTLTEADPSHYTEAGGATNLLEARLTFRLDRLLFADDEVALERVRIERSELRSRTAAKVLQTLFEWQRAFSLVQDSTLSTDEHFAAILREIEASAVLDVMTDGWFGRFRAHVRDAH